MTVGAVLLAAGASHRFGAEEKLLAPLNGDALIRHAARIVAGFPVRLAVVSSDAVRAEVERSGIPCLTVPAGRGQGDNLAAGVRAIGDVDRLAVFLGDMPFLRAEDVARLLSTDPHRPACATLNGVPLPPAIFPRHWLPRLAVLSGDRGAGALLRAGDVAHPAIPAAHLRDVDRKGDLDPIQSDRGSLSPM